MLLDKRDEVYCVMLLDKRDEAYCVMLLDKRDEAYCVMLLDKGDKAYNPLCHATWQERRGLQSTEPLFNKHVYWNAWNVLSLTVTASPDDLLAVKIQCCLEELLFVYHRSSWITQQSL